MNPQIASDMNATSNILQAAEEIISAVVTVLHTLEGKEGAPTIGHVLEELRQYAWSGVSSGSSEILERLHEISVAVELFKGSLITPAGQDLVSEKTVELINRITNAAHARHNLDEGEPVTIEWLAALANVSERTIRSATNSKNPNAMPIIKEGHWTRIEAPHALKWLSGRSDFQPTNSEDHLPRTAALAASLNVGETWKKWRESQKGSIGELALELGWSAEQTAAYCSIESGAPSEAGLGLSPGFWRRLAERFGSAESADVATLTYRRLAMAYVDWRIAQPD